jgi:hypothetical protein
MLSITPHRNLRRAAVAAALTLTAACAAPGAALAADAPTLGAPTIIPAGQKTPIDVGGNDLHQGAVIRKGTALVRWPVTMHGNSNAPITLACPDGTIHSGLGLQEGSDIAFAVVKDHPYFQRTIDVRFYTLSKVDPNGAGGHVYALCRDISVAPLAPELGFFPTIRKAGQTSPIDVAGNNLHRGDKIRRGTQLLRWSVRMLGASNTYLTLACPKGTVHRGLGQREGSKVSATLSPNTRYGHNTLKVRFSARPGAGPTAAGSVYALCGR